jgi:hypothetical protein
MPWMPVWLEEFIKAEGHVAKACRRAGISRTTAYRCHDEDPAFRAAWDEITEELVDGLDVSTLVLARDGQTETFTTAQGGESTRVTHYPRLREFVLTARRREVYGKRETV